jgi:hypothetical protein
MTLDPPCRRVEEVGQVSGTVHYRGEQVSLRTLEPPGCFRTLDPPCPKSRELGNPPSEDPVTTCLVARGALTLRGDWSDWEGPWDSSRKKVNLSKDPGPTCLITVLQDPGPTLPGEWRELGKSVGLSMKDADISACMKAWIFN